MASILTGLEIVPNVVGQDGNSLPAAITQNHRTMTIAGAGTTVSTAQVDATTNTTLASVPGLVQSVIPGNYKFRAVLPGTAGASGGVKYALLLTNATVSAAAISTRTFTATGVAVANSTTATSPIPLAGSTSATILTEVDGTFTVSAVTGVSGTVTLQFAQNASDAATSSVYVGAFMNIVRY